MRGMILWRRWWRKSRRSTHQARAIAAWNGQLRQRSGLQSASDLLLLLLDRTQGCHGQVYLGLDLVEAACLIHHLGVHVVELLLQQGQVIQLGDNRRKLLFEELADTFLHLVHGGANLTGVRGLTIWHRGESSVSPREEQVNP